MEVAQICRPLRMARRITFRGTFFTSLTDVAYMSRETPCNCTVYIPHEKTTHVVCTAHIFHFRVSDSQQIVGF